MPTAQPQLPWIFLLGGRDLEMVTIRALLERVAPGRFHDRQLAWGAKASAYRAEIDDALKRGMTPVLIELDDDLGLTTGPDADRVAVVDHHGARAGTDQPTALEQVFARLGLPDEEWSRWYELVSANDRGHVRAMQAAGASVDEVRQVRAADRAAQGITAEEEAAGRVAAEHAESRHGGRLTVVRLPHGRTATVADALEAATGGPGYENLLVFCPGQTVVYGTGKAIDALRNQFPGGYYGGDLPERGYWGHATPLDPSLVVPALEAAL